MRVAAEQPKRDGIDHVEMPRDDLLEGSFGAALAVFGKQVLTLRHVQSTP